MPPTNYSRAPRHMGSKTPPKPLAIQRLALAGNVAYTPHGGSKGGTEVIGGIFRPKHSRSPARPTGMGSDVAYAPSGGGKMQLVSRMLPRKHGHHPGRPAPLSGPHGGHHHHGGGGRGWIPPFVYGGPVAYDMSPAVVDPCTAPALYPPGTCAAIMRARVANPLGDPAYQNKRSMQVYQERVEGMGGACCEGCASGSQCSGSPTAHLSGVMDMVPGSSTPMKLAFLAGAGTLAYLLLKR